MNFDITRLFLKIVGLLSPKERTRLDWALHQSALNDSALYSEYSHHAYWENQVDSWQSMPSPVRPSKEEMRIYAQLLKDKEIKNALILGSTPELRDLLAEKAETKVYVADFSYRMPYAMLKFTRRVDPLKERWIKENWLELAFPEEFFDVILGDLVLQQLPPHLEPVFLEKMRSLLKTDGVFITRLHFLDERLQRQNIEDVVSKTLKSSLTDRERFILLKLRILWLFANPEKRLLNREISAREFERFVNANGADNAITRRALASLRADKDSYRSWSPPKAEELVRILSTHFNILDKKIANDYEDAPYYPIYVLRPKRNT